MLNLIPDDVSSEILSILDDLRDTINIVGGRDDGGAWRVFKAECHAMVNALRSQVENYEITKKEGVIELRRIVSVIRYCTKGTGPEDSLIYLRLAKDV